MWELAGAGVLSYARTFPMPSLPGGFVSVRTLTMPGQGPPLSRPGSRLAILVYQGSDPTQPYPTLVIRDRASRFRRLCALGT